MTDLPLILLGGGGYAHAVVDVLRLKGSHVAGFLDPDGGRQLAGLSRLGDDDAILGFDPLKVRLVNCVGMVDADPPRAGVFERFKARGYQFERVIHPVAVIARDVVLEEGVHVFAGAVIQPNCVIGDDSIVNIGALIDHDCRIGRHTHLAPGVSFSGGISVGDGTMIGTGASVIQYLSIGSGCLVAAGAAVVRNVPDGSRVAGVPARPLGNR